MRVRPTGQVQVANLQGEGRVGRLGHLLNQNCYGAFRSRRQSRMKQPNDRHCYHRPGSTPGQFRARSTCRAPEGPQAGRRPRTQDRSPNARVSTPIKGIEETRPSSGSGLPAPRPCVVRQATRSTETERSCGKLRSPCDSLAGLRPQQDHQLMVRSVFQL
jgi:hypothetical protein